ncbi:MAG: hypothetical protein QGG56_01910 [Dehalococcoidia bacterium]|jgi:hypothetical protein|nr:hypothetical protein [Dehalococcoidia bacterium]
MTAKANQWGHWLALILFIGLLYFLGTIHFHQWLQPSWQPFLQQEAEVQRWSPFLQKIEVQPWPLFLIILPGAIVLVLLALSRLEQKGR